MPSTSRLPVPHKRADKNAEFHRRLGLLIRRLPDWMEPPILWLLGPKAGWVRVPVGLLLIVGGFLAILPVFGLWMTPLGLVLLTEDVPPLKQLTGKVLEWIERKHPTWMGLPEKQA